MGRRAVLGMHGFHPDDPHSSAAFLSSRAVAPLPSDIKDLAAILLGAAREAAA
jgi:hypothetical protein